MPTPPTRTRSLRLRPLSLHTRVGLVLTGLAGVLLLILTVIWQHSTRQAIAEEVEAATRVSQQWLAVLLAEAASLPAEAQNQRLLEVARAIGRVRAHVLEIHDLGGELLYRSPPSRYKAGQHAPAAFASWLAPQLATHHLGFKERQLTLHPDTSRAVLDAWDELRALAGWALCLLIALFFASRHALGRALRPLDQVIQAMERTGYGCLNTRLPHFATPELGRLASTFNGMTLRLGVAIDDNIRLETERALAQQMQAHLEAERCLLARELHDELAQGITAVRAIAGAIVQRTREQPELHGHAQSIVAVTGEMQEGVRQILLRLRPLTGDLGERLEQRLALWQAQHPGMALQYTLRLAAAPLAEPLVQACLRIVQEGLTNIVRHAQARRVELLLEQTGDGLQLLLSDDGTGWAPGATGHASRTAAQGCGLGLRGVAERVAALGGQWQITSPPGQGFSLSVFLPVMAKEHTG